MAECNHKTGVDKDGKCKNCGEDLSSQLDLLENLLDTVIERKKTKSGSGGGHSEGSLLDAFLGKKGKK
jgi:hypothetical protein